MIQSIPVIAWFVFSFSLFCLSVLLDQCDKLRNNPIIHFNLESQDGNIFHLPGNVHEKSVLIIFLTNVSMQTTSNTYLLFPFKEQK